MTTLNHIFVRLVHWLSPFLCFTTEEAWLNYKDETLDSGNSSIHLSTAPETPATWQNDILAAQFADVIAARSVVTGALEKKRADKTIGASLEAAPEVYVTDKKLAENVSALPFADICITSDIAVKTADLPKDAFTGEDVKGIGVVFVKAEGDKCERCWKYLPSVGQDKDHPTVCARCAATVSRDEESAAA